MTALFIRIVHNTAKKLGDNLNGGSNDRDFILSYLHFRSYLPAVTSSFSFHRYDSSMILFDSSSSNLVIF